MKTILLISLILSLSSAHATEVIFEKDNSLPIVYINAAFKVGAAHDPLDQSGLAHLLCQMMLRGTTTKTKTQIDEAIDQLGARLECETRAESIVFRGAVLSGQFQKFSELFLDILSHPTFPDSELVKLKAEVTSKILEQQGKDNTLAKRHFDSWFFGTHPYAKPIIGKLKTIPNITSSSLRSVFDKWIHAGTLLIVGTGDVDQSEIETFSRQVVKNRPPKESPPFIEAPSIAAKQRVQFIDKPDRSQTQINVGQLGIKLSDSKYHALYLANHAFGGGSFTARMMTEIRVKRGWSYGAYSYFKDASQPKLWQYYLFPASKDTLSALKVSLDMVKEFQKSGITQAEFDSAKRSLVNNAGFNFNTPLKRVENTLSERLLGLKEGFWKDFGNELSDLSIGEVNSAVSSFIKPDQLSISVLGTASQLRAGVAKTLGIDEKEIQTVSYSEDP